MFLQLVVDEAKGYMKDFPMWNKAEAADAILKGIRKLKLAVGKKVKSYHADKAREQKTKKLISALDSNGTQVTLTVPYSSEHNNFIERRFGRLSAATRAALLSSGLQ